jgi:dihydroorotase-like cyclic amidohydrolase
MESCCKNTKDKDGLWEALLDDRIDVIATDHAPHTAEEKRMCIQNVLQEHHWFSIHWL